MPFICQGVAWSQFGLDYAAKTLHFIQRGQIEPSEMFSGDAINSIDSSDRQTLSALLPVITLKNTADVWALITATMVEEWGRPTNSWRERFTILARIPVTNVKFSRNRPIVSVA